MKRTTDWKIVSLLSVLAAIAACGDDGDGSEDADPDTGIDAADGTGDAGGEADTDASEGDSGTDGGTDAAADVLPDTDPDGGVDIEEDVVEPFVVESTTVVQNPANALSALVLVDTSAPATVSVRVEDPDGEIVWTAETDEAADSSELFVAAMRPQTQYRIVVTADNAADERGAGAFEDYTTPALPDDFPTLEAEVIDAEAMSDGFTLFNIFRWSEGGVVDNEWAYLVIVDEEGVPVWYYRTSDRAAFSEFFVDDGMIRYEYGDRGFVEINFEGEELIRRTNEDLGVDAVHHELYELPDGNIAFLGLELRPISGYPDDATFNVVGDTIVEIDGDGAIVRELSTFDMFDPLVTGPSFNTPFWDIVYPEVTEGGTKDWTHGNALIHDEADDTFIVSFRHLDTVAKIDRESGEVVWELGPNGDFILDGEGEWFYHQHAPMISPDGERLLIFDNGNFRPLDEEADNYSRLVEYELAFDEDGLPTTATETWSFASVEWYAPFLGDADYTDAGTVLGTFGGRVSDPTLPLNDENSHKSATLAEVTMDSEPGVVWQLTVPYDEANDLGYSVYRAQRIPSLQMESSDE